MTKLTSRVQSRRSSNLWGNSLLFKLDPPSFLYPLLLCLQTLPALKSPFHSVLDLEPHERQKARIEQGEKGESPT